MAKKNAGKQNEKAKTRKGASKLRRTVMGTLSGIFLISALIVAAIPVKESVAAGEEIATGITFTDKYDAKPDIPSYESADIFYTQDGMFGIAYTEENNNKIGVVVYYNKRGLSAGTSVVIPANTVAFEYVSDDYFPVYKTSAGRFEHLYYMSKEAVYSEEEDDNPPQVIEPAEYSVCTANNMDKWAVTEGENVVYKTFSDSDGQIPQEPLVIPIRCVGSKRYNPDYQKEGTSKFENKGVFEENGQIGSVTFPEGFFAIGDNAFKDCSVTSLSVSTTVESIGNHAFDGCIGLTQVTLKSPTNLTEIGSYAFANCGITEITIPYQVKKIGSGCFMNSRLRNINLYDNIEDGATSLNYVGDGLFYNCINLQQVALPQNIKNIDTAEYLFYGCTAMEYLGLPSGDCEVGGDNVFGHTNVTGCEKLWHVSALNTSLTFECDCKAVEDEDTEYKIGDGAKCTFGKINLGAFSTLPPGTYEVSKDFYIDVPGHARSESYTYASEHQYAVKYGDTFERIRGNYYYCVEPVTPGSTNGRLTSFGLSKEGADESIVYIPDQIGPMRLVMIEQSFKNNNKIEYIHIPASVETIGSEAFVGCTLLSEVEFADATKVKEIAPGAFKTSTTDKDLQLRFVGTISPNSEPYKYAMDTNNNYNDRSLGVRYISYTSQFPYNLEVELRVEKDPVTGQVISAVPTLVSAPNLEQFQDLKNGSLGEDGARVGDKDGSYSLSSYDRQREEQNAIVASTRAKVATGIPYGELAEDEQEVYDAVFRAALPEGIYAMDPEVYQGRDYLTSAVLNSIVEVPDYAFAGCTKLQTFIMYSSGVEGGERLGDMVFADKVLDEDGNVIKTFQPNESLNAVLLPETLSEMGNVPFLNCSKLENVNFNSNPKFSCVDAIIYEKKSDGTLKIVECLKPRGITIGTNTIWEDEFENVTELAPNAFRDCTGIVTVKFGNAEISTIPESCFEGCSNLTNCEVSPNTRTIESHAFKNTNLSNIRIPAGVLLISDDAFVKTDAEGNDKDLTGLNIECENPSPAYEYAVRHGFGTRNQIAHVYEVNFFNYNGTAKLCDPQFIEEGKDAVPPEAPSREAEGLVFDYWFPAYTNVTSDLNIYPHYKTIPTVSDNTVYHTVTFYNTDGQQKISVQSVPHGGSATAPGVNPEKDGYTFTGWLPEFTNVTTDLDVYPQFRQGIFNVDDPNGNGNGNGSGNNGSGNGGGNSVSGNGSGNGGSGNGNGNGGGNGAGTNGGNSNGSNGSGSGGGSSVSGNGTNRPNSSNRGNTKVDVNKTGLSNTGLITATVNGSTDDFVVKITDSESARNAVEQALLNEYGSLENIRYFAMDISLYDRTGTTKIQNTDGITVTITMPIPDALRSYGGNNKAGAVVGNNTLQKLDARFTTIDGVPCISFVATHFSPYTIYVDLNNLSASGMVDATPTTGDPIHPKWFLSIGLLLMSIMMFCMKGSKRTVVKVISG
ncbi:MAG: leucine-rich repeat protein [Lachnospiraceae bacterium]|nr:leucine-rich repeat protein [Lachnospiraceae bacterium]